MPACSASITPSAHPLPLRTRELPRFSRGVNLRAPERLVGVDVADPRDEALVEENRLHGRSPCRVCGAQVLGAEPLVEGLRAEPRGEERLERVGAADELRGAEAPRVGDDELLPRRRRRRVQRGAAERARRADPHAGS